MHSTPQRNRDGKEKHQPRQINRPPWRGAVRKGKPFSARIQTVHKETNPQYHALLSAFKEKTGDGLLVNTSFNVRGEPIVCTPEDAYKCLMRTEMDYLVIGKYLFFKQDQPEWKEKDNWKDEYVLD